MFDPFLEIIVLDGSLKLNNMYYKKLRKTLKRILMKKHALIKHVLSYGTLHTNINTLLIYIKIKPLDRFYVLYPHRQDTIIKIPYYTYVLYGSQFLIGNECEDVYLYTKTL